MNTPWKQLTFPEPAQLNPAISYIHHAAQITAAVGNSLLPKEEDDSQSNLEWLSGINALGGQMIGGKFRAALRYLPFELLILDDQNRIREAMEIPGHNKQYLMDWLQNAVRRIGGAGREVKAVKHFKIPDHPVGKGKAYPDIDPALHMELINYRSNANWILDEVGGLFEEVSPVRTWPHHFDTGAVITLERDKQDKAAKTIGIGWSIPNAGFEDPYFYVNHWTATGQPDYGQLPDLEGAGKWHLGSWKGAVLPCPILLDYRMAADQQQEALQFFRSAILATQALLKE